MDPASLVLHVQKSIMNAFNNISQISGQVIALEGMSGNKTRHLYNNICNLPGATYLEVGAWKGSTFISAMYNNTNIHGISVENWSEFNGPRDEFLTNLQSNLTHGEKYTLLDKDCWDINESDIPKSIDIYVYDGWHSYESQKKAITHYHKFFSKYVILMIDDWSCDWVDVKRGTMDGIAEMKLKVLYTCEIGLVNTNQHHFGGDTFWNGCGVFVCERTDIPS